MSRISSSVESYSGDAGVSLRSSDSPGLRHGSSYSAWHRSRSGQPMKLGAQSAAQLAIAICTFARITISPLEHPSPCPFLTQSACRQRRAGFSRSVPGREWRLEWRTDYLRNIATSGASVRVWPKSTCVRLWDAPHAHTRLLASIPAGICQRCGLRA